MIVRGRIAAVDRRTDLSDQSMYSPVAPEPTMFARIVSPWYRGGTPSMPCLPPNACPIFHNARDIISLRPKSTNTPASAKNDEYQRRTATSMHGILHSFFPSSSFNHAATLICSSRFTSGFRLKPWSADCATEESVELIAETAADTCSSVAFCRMLASSELPYVSAESTIGCGSNQLLWKS